MRESEIGSECKQEKITSGQTDLEVSKLSNQSPAFKEEEEQEDNNRDRWLLFEAQRVGVAEGLHKPDAKEDKSYPSG